MKTEHLKIDRQVLRQFLPKTKLDWILYGMTAIFLGGAAVILWWIARPPAVH